MATAATCTRGKRALMACRRSSSASHCAPRVARKASATGPRSQSWQTLRISRPRTWQAGRVPAVPCRGLVATLASPSSAPSASGIANAGMRLPTGGPVELAWLVVSVLTVKYVTARKSATPTNHA